MLRDARLDFAALAAVAGEDADRQEAGGLGAHADEQVEPAHLGHLRCGVTHGSSGLCRLLYVIINVQCCTKHWGERIYCRRRWTQP